MEPESMRKGGSRNSNCVRRINNMRSMHIHYTFDQTSNRGVQIIMKKLILSVFMFALIAGASVNSTANATLAESPGVVATPNLIYCLASQDIRKTSAGVLGTIAGGWGIKTGLGIAAVAGLTVSGLVVGLAVGV